MSDSGHQFHFPSLLEASYQTDSGTLIPLERKPRLIGFQLSHPSTADARTLLDPTRAAMAGPRLIPIIVGVGDVCNKSLDLANAFEPAELMTRAIHAALQDSGIAEHDFAAQLDSISVVPPWTWPYPDLPGLLAQRLGSSPAHKAIGKYHGGNQPALLCDDTARLIATGDARIAVVTGGEALASRESPCPLPF